ncbi:hypothetical protein PRIPAC_93007, partial [Pristionchus pacificus]|uniref:Uncharacterized protein n=1 Tax=Pristionchus pacificus TaxID=54126 RepID=A0A2A6BP50_PRIPA
EQLENLLDTGNTEITKTIMDRGMEALLQVKMRGAGRLEQFGPSLAVRGQWLGHLQRRTSSDVREIRNVKSEIEMTSTSAKEGLTDADQGIQS